MTSQVTGNSISAFIFDLDGVLVDTAKYHFQAWSAMARSIDILLDEEDNEKLKGVGRMESLDYILGKDNRSLSQNDREKLAASKNHLYLEFVGRMDATEILPGVSEFLAGARTAGLLLCVGSGSKNAEMVLKRIQLRGMFDAVCDGNDISHSKPHPEIFQKCCSVLGIAPSKAVVFEDAYSGIEAANAAGCHSVGIGTPENLGNAELCFPGFEHLHYLHILQGLNKESQ